MRARSFRILLPFVLSACFEKLPAPEAFSSEPASRPAATLRIYTHGKGTVYVNNATGSILPAGCRPRPDGADCTLRNASVLLSAIADAGWYFARWDKRKCGTWLGCLQELRPGQDEILHAYFAPQVCRAGFCWENPGPQGNTLRDLWGTDGQLWAVGKNGTILHFDGETWRGQESTTFAHLGAVWGTTGNDIWAAGDSGTLLHFDGTEWKAMEPPPPISEQVTLRAGSSLPKGKLLVVAKGGIALSFDGASWHREPTGTLHDLYAVWASGDFAIAAGDKDTLLQRNPTTGTWSPLAHPAGAVVLNSIWGVSPSDIWVAGDNSTLLHYDGNVWALSPSPYPGGNIVDLWGQRGDDLWAVFWQSREGDPEDVPLLHYDGKEWTMRRVYGQRDLWAIHGRSADELWAVGKEGVILRARARDGWQADNLTVGLRIGLHGVYSASQQEGWAVGDTGTLLRLSSTRQPTNEAKMNELNLRRVRGRSRSDIWAVGGLGAMLHFDGSKWVDVPSNVSHELLDIALTPGSQRNWAVGEMGRVLALENTQIRESRTLSQNAKLQAAALSRDGKKLFVAGSGPTLALFDGGDLRNPIWMDVAAPEFELSDVVERNGGLLAVGGRKKNDDTTEGILLTQSGPTKLVPAAFPADAGWLRSIDGVDGDLWAVGDKGTILHFQAGVWRRESAVTHQNLTAISYCTAKSFFIVGSWGTILRWGPRGEGACTR